MPNSNGNSTDEMHRSFSCRIDLSARPAQWLLLSNRVDVALEVLMIEWGGKLTMMNAAYKYKYEYSVQVLVLANHDEKDTDWIRIPSDDGGRSTAAGAGTTRDSAQGKGRAAACRTRTSILTEWAYSSRSHLENPSTFLSISSETFAENLHWSNMSRRHDFKRENEYATQERAKAASASMRSQQSGGSKKENGIRMSSLTHDEDGVPIKWLSPVKGGLSKQVMPSKLLMINQVPGHTCIHTLTLPYFIKHDSEETRYMCGSPSGSTGYAGHM